MSKPTENRPELPVGWFYPNAAEMAHLQREFERELPPGHRLFGIPIEVFAISDGTDDTLFRHLNEPDRFTVVHLTWIGRTEINAEHPTVPFYGSFADFCEREAEIMALIQRLSAGENESHDVGQ